MGREVALTPFGRALANPERAQRRAFERARDEVLALGRVRSLEHLRELPLCTYDDIERDIDRVADGVGGLTRAPLLRFELSGGSSGAQKLLPVTRPFLAEMNRALMPWLLSLYARADVRAGPAYWSVSPMGKARGTTTRAGVPIGGDDASWFHPALQPVLARVLAVPSTLSGFRDVEACRYATLRVLLEREDLAFISVWSPTFLSLLMETFDRERARLLDDLARGTLTLHEQLGSERPLALRAMPERAARLRSGEAPWPRLALISMWTDAAAASFVEPVRARFPNVRVQGKGLLATEGVTSIPWPSASGDGAPVLAVRSHVLEFLDVSPGASGRTSFAHEIEDGRTYEVVLTTSAGLVRYRTGDLVRVEGAALATPRVRFLGRSGASDLVGEKLAPAFVGRVLDEVVRGAKFAMLAPTHADGPNGGAHYRLYLESDTHDAAAVAREVDARLSEGHPYRYARELGQLGPVEGVPVKDGARSYERACVKRGQRAGDVKPTPLHTARDWEFVSP